MDDGFDFGEALRQIALGNTNYTSDTSLTSDIENVLETVKNENISDFYHMNKYTTREYDWGFAVTYNIAGASKSSVHVTRENDLINILVDKGHNFDGLKDVLWVPNNINKDKTLINYNNGLLIISMYLAEEKGNGSIEMEII